MTTTASVSPSSGRSTIQPFAGLDPASLTLPPTEPIDITALAWESARPR